MASINNMKAMLNRETRKHLRVHATESWRKECLRKANYTCAITGKKATKGCQLDVHHANKTFDSIMYEAHKKLNIKHHRYITEYKPGEIDLLIQEIKEMHKDVQGIVILHTMHMEFHQQYGKKATYDDYKTFKKYKKTKLYKAKNGSHRKIA
jgi:hypothetical protein